MLLVAYLREPRCATGRCAGRPGPARADGSPVRQRRGHARARHRRQRRPRAAGAPGRHARLRARRRSGGCRASTPPTSRCSSCRSTASSRAATAPRRCGCWLDRAVAALGHRPRAPARLGALLQGRLGLGQRRRRPPGRAAAARRRACRWRSSRRAARATPTASGRCAGWRRGCCAGWQGPAALTAATKAGQPSVGPTAVICGSRAAHSSRAARSELPPTPPPPAGPPAAPSAGRAAPAPAPAASSAPCSRMWRTTTSSTAATTAWKTSIGSRGASAGGARAISSA